MSEIEKALDAYKHALLHHDEMGGCDPNDCEVWEEEKANARAAVLSALPTKAQIDRIVDAMPTVMGDVTYRRITAVGSHGIMVSDDAVHTDWLRAALYRAAGIEGEA